MEIIPIPDDLRKETTFICFYTSRGFSKCRGIWFSATPSLGVKVTCKYSDLYIAILVDYPKS